MGASLKGFLSKKLFELSPVERKHRKKWGKCGTEDRSRKFIRDASLSEQTKQNTSESTNKLLRVFQFVLEEYDIT